MPASTRSVAGVLGLALGLVSGCNNAFATNNGEPGGCVFPAPNFYCTDPMASNYVSTGRLRRALREPRGAYFSGWRLWTFCVRARAFHL